MNLSFVGDWMDKLANLPFVPSARTCLVTALMILMVLSLAMVASASIPEAIKSGLPALKFFWSQLFYMGIALFAGLILYFVPLKRMYDPVILMIGTFVLIGLLMLTLASEPINGSRRWLSIGPMSFQPAEYAKFLMVFVAAEYVQRRSYEVRHSITSMMRIMLWYLPTMVLLKLQPDFGSIVMLVGVLVMIFWAAGVPLTSYLVALAGVIIIGIMVMIEADYRMLRVVSFLDPFDDVQDTDFQVSRSLVALARGEWTGVGYSNSIFKLSHLPEAHTDFLLAVTGEEFGFWGVGLVLFLEFVIIASIMRISYNALSRHQAKLSYTCFGFAVLIFGQVLINAGMNLGIMPPKGLTMPFFSYGGSAMLFFIMMIAVVLKIDKQSPIIAANHKSRDY